jgi:hypothetical protein
LVGFLAASRQNESGILERNMQITYYYPRKGGQQQPPRRRRNFDNPAFTAVRRRRSELLSSEASLSIKEQPSPPAKALQTFHQISEGQYNKPDHHQPESVTGG